MRSMLHVHDEGFSSNFLLPHVTRQSGADFVSIVVILEVLVPSDHPLLCMTLSLAVHLLPYYLPSVFSLLSCNCPEFLWFQLCILLLFMLILYALIETVWVLVFYEMLVYRGLQWSKSYTGLCIQLCKEWIYQHLDSEIIFFAKNYLKINGNDTCVYIYPCSTGVLGSNPTRDNICMEFISSPHVSMDFF